MNLTKLATVAAAVGIAVSAFGSTAHAEELAGILKKIKDIGTTTLGVRDSPIPFSYNIGGVRTVGYSYDIATKITEGVKKQLDLKNPKVNEIPVTSQSRITLLQDGIIDLGCGSTTSNLERQKQASFTSTVFIIGMRIMVKKDSGVKDWADLKGENVVTAADTTSERLLCKMNDGKQMSMNIISTKDHGQSFLTLESSRAVVSIVDDALPYGEHAKARNPTEWVVVARPQSHKVYDCMVRRDNRPFRALADEAIVDMMEDDTINAEYKKRFEQSVPPKGVNVEFPLSDDMKALIKNPSDKALD